MSDEPDAKRLRKAAKKARRKASVRTKTYMEISRTICSLGGLVCGALSLLHVYHII